MSALASSTSSFVGNRLYTPPVVPVGMGLSMSGLSLSHASPPHALIATRKGSKLGGVQALAGLSEGGGGGAGGGAGDEGGGTADGAGHTGAPAAGNEDLDLMYDPMLNCYYDPKTNKYYELA